MKPACLSSFWNKNLSFNIVFILFFFNSFHSFSNPIMPPPMIIEIYFGPDGWQIELMNNGFESETTLDHIWLWASDDAAHFVPGIDFQPNELVVVTQDDLMSILNINQECDNLTLYYINGDEHYWFDEIGMHWGQDDPPDYFGVDAPVGDQSVAYQKFLVNDEDWEFWDVIESPNTIGFSPFHVSKKASFSGYVMDRNGGPLSNIFIRYCDYAYNSSPLVPMIWTGEDGHFSTGNMYCRRYYITFRTEGPYGPVLGDTNIDIIPDSANYYEFVLDTLLTDIKELNPYISLFSVSCYPVPAYNEVTFTIESNENYINRKGVIKIYSDLGFIIDIIPIDITADKQDLNYNLKQKSLVPGTYFYSLEINQHKMTSGKMIISQ